MRYETEDGDWEEIDPTLIPKEESGGKVVLKSKATPIEVQLAADANSSTLIELSKDNYNIKINPKGGGGSRSVAFVEKDGQVSAAKTANVSLSANKEYLAVEYDSVLSADSTLTLKPLGMGVKEEIILEQCALSIVLFL